MIKALFSGQKLRFGAEMPFAKKAAGVSFQGEKLREADLLLAEVSRIGGRNTVAERITTGQTAAAGWGADWSCRVKAGEPNPRSGHLIEMRSNNPWVPIEPGVSPPQIISHAEDEIGGVSLFGKRGKANEKQERKKNPDHGDRVIYCEG